MAPSNHHTSVPRGRVMLVRPPLATRTTSRAARPTPEPTYSRPASSSGAMLSTSVFARGVLSPNSSAAPIAATTPRSIFKVHAFSYCCAAEASDAYCHLIDGDSNATVCRQTSTIGKRTQGRWWHRPPYVVSMCFDRAGQALRRTSTAASPGMEGEWTPRGGQACQRVVARRRDSGEFQEIGRTSRYSGLVSVVKPEARSISVRATLACLPRRAFFERRRDTCRNSVMTVFQQERTAHEAQAQPPRGNGRAGRYPLLPAAAGPGRDRDHRSTRHPAEQRCGKSQGSGVSRPCQRQEPIADDGHRRPYRQGSRRRLE